MVILLSIMSDMVGTQNGDEILDFIGQTIVV